jgi:hypothetical protein
MTFGEGAEFNMPKLIVSRLLWMSCFLVILLAGLAAAGTGCGSGNGVKDALDQHRERWADQDIDSYRYELQVVCFCPPEATGPVLVIVRDGITDSVLYVANGNTPEQPYFERYDTIEDLFLVIDDALDQEAHEIDVTYDETLGFPTRIAIDFIEAAIDDEVTYTISRFQAFE